MDKGLFVVISGPSGVGKGTVLSSVLKKNENYVFSVSNTTRPARKGEIDGYSYNFISKKKFLDHIAEGDMLEWTKYNEDYYGTPKGPIEEHIKKGKDVFLDIEVEGSLQIKGKIDDAILIFLMPPDFSDLKKRLKNRGTESSEQIKKRVEKAKLELTFLDRYDYIVFNENVENAVSEIEMIIKAEKLRYKRMSKKIKEVVCNV